MKPTLLVLLLVLSGTEASAAEPPVKRLNILFFTADDMNFDSSGVCGGPIKDLTPNLDRLASEGLRFEFAYSTVAVCQPVRQTMQTGVRVRASRIAGSGLLCPQAIVDSIQRPSCSPHLRRHPGDQKCVDPNGDNRLDESVAHRGATEEAQGAYTETISNIRSSGGVLRG